MSFKKLINNQIVSAPGVDSLIKENNPEGYFTKTDVLNNLDRLSSDPKLRYLIGNTNFLFSAMKQNISFTKMPQHIVENGQGYTWLALRVGRVSRNIKVPHFGEMQRLIDDYAMGVTKISSTLEELYDEASS